MFLYRLREKKLRSFFCERVKLCALVLRWYICCLGQGRRYLLPNSPLSVTWLLLRMMLSPSPLLCSPYIIPPILSRRPGIPRLNDLIHSNYVQNYIPELFIDPLWIHLLSNNIVYCFFIVLICA